MVDEVLAKKTLRRSSDPASWAPVCHDGSDRKSKESLIRWVWG
jgi:hypothetical protein